MGHERIYAATRIHEYTLSKLQDHLGLHYSTISRIASRVEAEQGSEDKTPRPRMPSVSISAT